jgi:hypothetical protein
MIYKMLGVSVARDLGEGVTKYTFNETDLGKLNAA